MDDKANSADYFELASFASFDMLGAVTVTVACPEAIQSARVLPSSFGIDPTVEGRRLRLTLKEPKPATVEVNGRPLAARDVSTNAFVRNVTIRP
jgi:hypothetical protein